ncbi:MAG TPA: hypothetical protein VHS59_08860, partial [Bacillota bacterium]|nr:hypothetical protein [Bacillota bacterium]
MSTATMDYQLPDFSVIDFHAHFPVETDDILGRVNEEYLSRHGDEKLTVLKHYSLKMNLQWRQAWCFPQPEQVSQSALEANARRWSAEASKYNLAKIVFVTGGGNDCLHRV